MSPSWRMRIRPMGNLTVGEIGILGVCEWYCVPAYEGVAGWGCSLSISA